MTITSLSRAVCFALFAAACALPAQAASTAASSASSAGSASSGSVSDSIGASSNSSGDDRRRVAAGQYRVIDIAAAPGKPGTTRMTLQAAAEGAAREFTLDVPNRALAQRAVSKGELVQVNAREYGYEFAHADTKQSFFLALEDSWYRELGSHKVAI
jgi:hypothetical protein